ncbi:MAG TPA: sulfatase [Candidatus Binatia bacterium]|jgi:arylsulfatase
MPRPQARGVPARAWTALFAGVALWEIFLRADSRVLAPATKLWLFPLLVLAFVCVGGALVRLAAATGGALLGRERARALARPAFALAAGAAAGVEYALLTLTQPTAPLRLAPVVVLAAAVLAWLAARAVADGTTGGRAGLAALAAVVTGLGFAAALFRPDIGAALIKRNSAFGRMLGHSLARVPRALPPAAPVTRPPNLPAAAPLGRANVVLFTIDALRRDGLGTYNGRADASPRIDAFARSALVFDDAYTQVPSSAPSLATTLTGRYPAYHHLRENRMTLGADQTTLAETLNAAGYATAAFVTNPNFAQTFHLDQGFATFRFIPSDAFAFGLLLDASDPKAVDAALDWLRSVPQRPFLLWVHIMAPHSPYVPPEDLRPPLRRDGPWVNVWNMGNVGRVAPGTSYFDLGVYRALYAAEVRSADRIAGRFFDELAALDLLDRSHVLVFADHGEAFGENDVFAHGRSVDPGETRVPLLWHLPGGAHAGERVPTTVELVDVVPTLTRLLGIAMPGTLDGRDLSGALLDPGLRDDGFAFTQARFLDSMGVRGLLYAVRTRARTLWLDAGYGYEGEYDRERDPLETRMVSYVARPGDTLHDTLLGLARTTQESLRVPAVWGAIDRDELERLRALGYVH